MPTTAEGFNRSTAAVRSINGSCLYAQFYSQGGREPHSLFLCTEHAARPSVPTFQEMNLRASEPAGPGLGERPQGPQLLSPLAGQEQRLGSPGLRRARQSQERAGRWAAGAGAG